MFKVGASDLVFPGQNVKKPLSDMTLLKILRDMGITVTVHGFRSAFRDWVAEKTDYPGEVAEAALAHTVSNKVEAAYHRTDFLEKRRLLMQAWAAFCSGWRVRISGTSHNTAFNLREYPEYCTPTVGLWAGRVDQPRFPGDGQHPAQ